MSNPNATFSAVYNTTVNPENTSQALLQDFLTTPKVRTLTGVANLAGQTFASTPIPVISNNGTPITYPVTSYVQSLSVQTLAPFVQIAGSTVATGYVEVVGSLLNSSGTYVTQYPFIGSSTGVNMITCQATGLGLTYLSPSTTSEVGFIPNSQSGPLYLTVVPTGASGPSVVLTSGSVRVTLTLIDA